uniref:Uncharacterized protein n=1 Tax=viral metagenome TaxID=1070528 RepID=A0A6M3JAL2_9ZZZZ
MFYLIWKNYNGEYAEKFDDIREAEDRIQEINELEASEDGATRVIIVVEGEELILKNMLK